MNISEAANKPSDLEAKFRGETRVADGYQYWTTSAEDEEAIDIRERIAQSDQDESGDKPKKERRRILPPGAFRRTGVRFVSLVLLVVLAAIGYFVFNYVKVTGAAGDDTAQRADAIVVLGAAQYNGSPSNVLQERLDHAFNLYERGMAPRIFVTGAGAEGDDTTEGLVGYVHLIEKGVPEADLEVIPEGTNTWEQLSATAFQMELFQADSVILVSDSYHTYRLRAIADELGIEAYVSPSAIEPTVNNYLRESAAVSIGRITGYRRLSAFTE